uniref:Uncharacterized protein n=1 Tax=Chromera velia CCMP2878 TaxID=1169474 RepID=A0A0G4IEW0_9ALVE|eukprot:Cvel_13729.t1-p1 / transcript=Cvel_13729.t1 / gene=Cvel_13729 / organism=Chromera_velia_CCMP2878 / gene_product=Zinc finger protein 331, putative / transcript_product=Zinc finger protein 331, putative / location=Cvel_scaffold949:56712-57098(-) / protein_length=129 / sequence_SO=supercontig / SO=protein_coding / is_pseudo=false
MGGKSTGAKIVGGGAFTITVVNDTSSGSAEGRDSVNMDAVETTVRIAVVVKFVNTDGEDSVVRSVEGTAYVRMGANDKTVGNVGGAAFVNTEKGAATAGSAGAARSVNTVESVTRALNVKGVEFASTSV